MGRNRGFFLLVLVYIAGMLSDCEMVPVNGTVVAVGPVELAPDDTTYRYIVIREKGGALRDFTMVRARPGLSELIERDAIGVFLFWDSPAECRLWFVYRADGPHQVDFEAVRTFVS
jgi:hypothetical protein